MCKGSLFWSFKRRCDFTETKYSGRLECKNLWPKHSYFSPLQSRSKNSVLVTLRYIGLYNLPCHDQGSFWIMKTRNSKSDCNWNCYFLVSKNETKISVQLFFSRPLSVLELSRESCDL